VFCPRCGARDEAATGACASCGAALPAPSPPVELASWLVPAVLATLFCCQFLGIPAIVYAARVDPLLNAGDVAGAREAARKARFWCLLAVGTGLAFGLAYAVLMVFATIAERR
jgi:hypothetical protein